MRLEHSICVSLAIFLVLLKCSSFLGTLTIFRNWLAGSARAQMERFSASELRALLMTELVIFPEQSHISR